MTNVIMLDIGKILDFRMVLFRLDTSSHENCIIVVTEFDWSTSLYSEID